MVTMEMLDILQPLIKTYVYTLCIAVFVVGVVLLFQRNYEKVEEVLGKEAGIKKRIVPALETNIYSFHNWLIRRKGLIGTICVIASLAAIIELRTFLR